MVLSAGVGFIRATGDGRHVLLGKQQTVVHLFREEGADVVQGSMRAGRWCCVPGLHEAVEGVLQGAHGSGVGTSHVSTNSVDKRFAGHFGVIPPR